MIIDFSFSNFRSIKDEQFFSMQAESSKIKLDNIFEVTLADETELREASKQKLVKSSVIYGANASGKTNFIRAFSAFKYLITHSDTFKVDQKILCYEPFELEEGFDFKPTKFQITFIAGDSIKYNYEVEFGKNEIFLEKLNWYPKGQPALLFERTLDNAEFHSIKFGSTLKFKPNRKKVFKNQLFLSKFSSDEPNEQLTHIYLYFKELAVWNATDRFRINRLAKKISEEISDPANSKFTKRLSKLLRIADTKIENIFSVEQSSSELKFNDNFPEGLKEQIVQQNKFRPFATHSFFNKGQEIGVKEFDLMKNESTGTNVLFALGGIILKKLETGGIIIFDELDNSLHPRLCKFLIRLFNNPVSNPKNAQLIFATHEVTLLDKDIFRKDQIWFTEKNRFGQTELFSAQDVEGLRDDTNFEVWYRTGKFGGNPNIKEVEFIFGNE